jgi:hypothetical protein
MYTVQYMEIKGIIKPQSTYGTYVEYRAVSGVFQNIDHPPPLPRASVSFPHTKGRGVHTRRAVRGGRSIFWKTPDIGLAFYSIIPLRIKRLAGSFERNKKKYLCAGPRRNPRRSPDPTSPWTWTIQVSSDIFFFQIPNLFSFIKGGSHKIIIL